MASEESDRPEPSEQELREKREKKDAQDVRISKLIGRVIFFGAILYLIYLATQKKI